VICPLGWFTTGRRLSLVKLASTGTCAEVRGSTPVGLATVMEMPSSSGAGGGSLHWGGGVKSSFVWARAEVIGDATRKLRSTQPIDRRA
jgi:hypothetical protein